MGQASAALSSLTRSSSAKPRGIVTVMSREPIRAGELSGTSMLQAQAGIEVTLAVALNGNLGALTGAVRWLSLGEEASRNPARLVP